MAVGIKLTVDPKPLGITIVASTCHYYQVPLFREIAQHPRIQLKVIYCSEEALEGGDVQRWFNTSGRWGIENELLQGYDHEFLKNYSPKPSYINSFTGLMNFGVWNSIRREKPDAVILMSWMNPTWWIAMLACVQCQIPFFLMTDANVAGDMSNAQWKKWIKKLALGMGLFRWTSGFLCAGTANHNLFRSYGVPDRKLLSFAYSWGYKDLMKASEELRGQKSAFRKSLGIPQNSKVVLFCGRLNQIKRPFDLVDAYSKSAVTDKALVFVGDGEMNEELKSYVSKHNIPSVYFFGFQNRNEIGKFYATADVLVLPSISETLDWTRALLALNAEKLEDRLVEDTLSVILKYEGDVQKAQGELSKLIERKSAEKRAEGPQPAPAQPETKKGILH